MDAVFIYKDFTVHYQKEGNSAIPVILIHGFAEDGYVWDGQLAFLKEYTQVIVPHLPGSGRSDYNPQLSSVEDYAGCLLALLQHEKIETCIMLGHSMGGYITLAFTEDHSQYLRAFGFIHSTAFADSEEKKQNRLKGIAMMEEYGSYAFTKSTTPNLFSKAYKDKFSGRIDALVNKGTGFKKEALQQYYRAMMMRPDRTLVLRNSKMPVLFVAGTEDVAVPLADVLQQVHMPKISFFHILENTGHMGMWEETEKTNDFILNFINYVNTNP